MSEEAAPAEASEYKVSLENFAGPMDLLLHLIRKEEVEITDIPISRILDQYMAFMNMIDIVDLDEAGDFLVMASTLMVIKSKTLLPVEEVDLEEELDPRYELVQQLLEYKRVRERTATLDDARKNRALRVGRPDSARPEMIVEEDTSLDELEIWDVMKAFQKIIDATGGAVTRDRVIHGVEVPVREFAGRVEQRLKGGGRSRLSELVGDAKQKSEMIGYFLAVLILMKTQMVTAHQSDDFDDIELAWNEATEVEEQQVELEDDFN